MLKEAFKGKNLSFRKQYIKMRAFFLQQYYGINFALGPAYDQISIRSKNNKTVNKVRWLKFIKIVKIKLIKINIIYICTKKVLKYLLTSR